MIVVWTPEAEQDRADIWNYIAADNLGAAVRMDALFSNAAATLAAHPKMGETSSLSDLKLIYCGKAEIGQIFRSFSLKGPAIRLKRAKNLPQTGFPSLRSVKPDRLLARFQVLAS